MGSSLTLIQVARGLKSSYKPNCSFYKDNIRVAGIAKKRYKPKRILFSLCGPLYVVHKSGQVHRIRRTIFKQLSYTSGLSPNCKSKKGHIVIFLSLHIHRQNFQEVKMGIYEKKWIATSIG